MRFLIKIAQGHRISKELVELFGHLKPDRLFQFQMEGMSNGAVRLDFASALMHPRLGTNIGSRCVLL